MATDAASSADPRSGVLTGYDGGMVTRAAARKYPVSAARARRLTPVRRAAGRTVREAEALLGEPSAAFAPTECRDHVGSCGYMGVENAG